MTENKKAAGGMPMTFAMPMIKDFVPKAIRPWIYLLFAAIFQCTQAVNAGSMAHIMGDNGVLREDVMMIMFCGLVGVNLPFPFLFRFKFHFANRTMLIFSTSMLIVCVTLGSYVTWFPALCAVNFISGFFKLWATFECFSNIQLWMTPKRDFSIFFPLLYMVVLNSIELMPYLTAISNFYFDYRMMNVWTIIALVGVLIFLIICTRRFYFMKPMPLFGMDWLGMSLWAALMLELCYIFNYGEYYNWLDSPRIWCMCLAVMPTLYLAINRERHIHHPYIDPSAWKYKNVSKILMLFLFAEILSAVPNVCQNAIISTLSYDSLHVANFRLVSIAGVVVGCLISLLWIHFLRLSYVRLIAVSFAFMVASPVMIYFIIMPGINIEQFYIPTFLRNIGYAINFCAITIYLQQAMPFHHFFMGLTMMGFVRTGVGAAFGGAVYSFAMRCSMTCNIARFSGSLNEFYMWKKDFSEEMKMFMEQILMLSAKQIYGVTCVAGIFFVLLILMYSLPVKSTLKKMPYWNTVARKMKRDLF